MEQYPAVLYTSVMNDGCCCDAKLNGAFGASAKGDNLRPAPDLRYIDAIYKTATDDVLVLRNNPHAIGDIVGMLLGHKPIIDTKDHIADMHAQAHALGLRTDDLDRMSAIKTPQGRAECLLDMVVTNLDHAHQQVIDARNAEGAGKGTKTDLAASAATDTADRLAIFLTHVSPSAEHGCATLLNLRNRLLKLSSDCEVFEDYPPGTRLGTAPAPTSI